MKLSVPVEVMAARFLGSEVDTGALKALTDLSRGFNPFINDLFRSPPFSVANVIFGHDLLRLRGRRVR